MRFPVASTAPTDMRSSCKHSDARARAHTHTSVLERERVGVPVVLNCAAVGTSMPAGMMPAGMLHVACLMHVAWCMPAGMLHVAPATSPTGVGACRCRRSQHVVPGARVQERTSPASCSFCFPFVRSVGCLFVCLFVCLSACAVLCCVVRPRVRARLLVSVLSLTAA